MSPTAPPADAGPVELPPLTPKAVAAQLGVSDRFVIKLINTGRLRHVSYGAGRVKRYRMKPEWVAEYLRNIDSGPPTAA